MDCTADQIAVAGAARTGSTSGASFSDLASVVVYDCRKGTVKGTWSNCLKYEVNALHFNNAADACFVGGLDSGVRACLLVNSMSQIAYGGWRAGSQKSSFLADSRWIGLDKVIPRIVSFDGSSFIWIC